MAPANSLDPSSGAPDDAARQGMRSDGVQGAKIASSALVPEAAKGKALPPRPIKAVGPAGPARPESLEPRHLGFIPQGMVSWFDPAQLIQTGIRTMLSSVFGSYADKREIMPSLSAELPVYDYSKETDAQGQQREATGEFWLDFLADTGDGFDSTFTVASLVAAPELRIPGVTRPLPRGRVLVFGGDGVYPTASRDEYLNRLVGPFRAALPYVADEGKAPHIFALPGNHDWYDGLTAFLRLFTQGRWIGGWKSPQKRSYFALKLPHGWWLWGTDIQLGSDIDHPQRTFFENLARDGMRPGDRVILCTAEPTWSLEWLGHANAFQTLAFFEEKVLRRNGHEPPLVLSGDLHNYHRYVRADGALQRLTAGGGGAFLHGTSGLPQGEAALLEGDRSFTDPCDADPRPVKAAKAAPGIPADTDAGLFDDKGRTIYRFGKSFPSQAESRRLAKGARWAFFKRRSRPGEGVLTPRVALRSWGMPLFFSVYYLVGAWMVQSSSKKDGLTLVEQMYRFLDGPSPWSGMEGVRHAGIAFAQTAQLLFYLTLTNPALLVWALILTGGLIGFCAAKGFRKLRIGGFHAASHLASFALLFMGIIALNHLIDRHTGFKFPVSQALAGGVKVVPLKFAVAFAVEMGVGAFFASAFLFGNYLVRRQDLHEGEAFSCQGITGWKNFVKLGIDAQGTLRVYPIGMEAVCDKWKANPRGAEEEPLILPDNGGKGIGDLAKLIEGPLAYAPREGRWGMEGE